MAEIQNPRRNTPLPQQKGKMLSNQANKSNLIKFLFEDWINIFQDRAGDQILLLAGGFEDMTRAVSVKFGAVENVRELYLDHEEAD